MKPIQTFSSEGHYLELTVIILDKVTGEETTITGTVKDLVIAMPYTYDPPPVLMNEFLPNEFRHIGLHAEWVPGEDDARYYTVDFKVPSPNQRQ